MQAQSWGEETGLVSCQLAAAPPASGAFVYLAHAWKEEPHLTDSPALFCFTFLSFSFLRSPQKARPLLWHDAGFPGKPDGKCAGPGAGLHLGRRWEAHLQAVTRCSSTML